MFWRLVRNSLLIILSLMIEVVIASSASGQASWTSDQDMLLFYEAISKFQRYSMDSGSSQQIVRKAIRCSLKEQDGFSDYLSPEEYAAYKQSPEGAYAGVGMDLSLTAADQFFCQPYPKGPADRAGVRYGDVLLAVNGRNIAKESLYLVGASIRGQPGATVWLKVQTARNQPRDVPVVLESMQSRSVILEEQNSLLIIRILRFSTKTAEELKEILLQLKARFIKVIDLRGNAGGDLFSAIDAAAFFLKPESPIVSLKTRTGIQNYSVHPQPIDPESTLFLWQDGQTASAAELFIAALTQNGRAVSVGKTSYGKGVAQRFVDLTDGSALLLTYGAILPPSARSFHQTGLNPTHPLKESAASTDDDQAYLRKTAELLGIRKP